MSDQPRDLREHLERLQDELKRTQPANEDQRQHLASLQAEVQALLDGPAELSAQADPSVGERFNDSLVQFESTHPVLSSLIEQVLNTLSGAGI